VVAALLFPALAADHAWPGTSVLVLHAAVVAMGTLPVVLFLVRGQRLQGRRGARMPADVAAAPVLCSGLSWYLARAVAEGLWGRTGEFVRTPKTGSIGTQARHPLPARPSAGMAGIGELTLAGAILPLGAWAAATGRLAAAPFLLVLAAGLMWVG